MTTLTTDWTLLNDKTVSYGPWSGKFKLYAKILETDIANNRTKVAYDWDFETTAGNEVSSSNAQDYVTAAGWNTETFRTYSGSGNLRHGEEWLYHAADGTKSETCNGRTRMDGIGVDTGWVSASFNLPRIPRASSPNITPNPQTWSNTSSNTITVKTNRKASSFTHSVRCDVWSYNVTKTGVGESTTFDIPYSTLGSMPDDQLEFTGSVYTQTYSGSTAIGSKVRTLWTIKVDTSIEHPNIGTITVEDTNERTSAIVAENTFIYGISTLTATIPFTVSGSYTELASATVTCGTQSQTYSLSGTSQTITVTFDKVNASSLTVTVKDKRGTTASKSASWTLMAYRPVVITASIGRTTPTGSTAVGDVKGIAYGGNYGQASNSLTISYRYKEHDATTWIDGAETFTKSLNEGQQNFTQAITFSESFDYQKQYDIQIIASELFSTAVYTAQLMQGLPILSWDETEVDVFGDLHIHDRNEPTSWQDVMEGFNTVFEYKAVKNLLVNHASTATSNGITFTVNADGSVKVNGTATSNAYLNLNTNFTLEGGRQYILSGIHDDFEDYVQFHVRYASRAELIATSHMEDTVFTAPSEAIFVYIYVASGTTVNNLVLQPMIRDARIANGNYVQNKPSIFPDYTAPTATYTLTKSGTSTYTVAHDCCASLVAHIQANSNGIVGVTINNTSVSLSQTNGSCNYFYTRDFILKAGDRISIRLDTNASDNYLYLLPFRL